MRREVADGSYMASLYRISRLLNSSLELDRVLDNAIDSVISLMQAERGFIVLKDRKDNELRFQVARNMDREEIEAPNLISRTVVEMVVKDGQPLLTSNAQEDPRLAARSSVIQYGLRSVLCAPLRIKEQTIGAIYLDNRLLADVFREEDIEMLLVFSDLAAVAIENARLYQELRDSYEEKIELQQRLHAEEVSCVEAETSNALKTEWVQWVSHELKSPLTVIRGFAHTLLLRDSEGEWETDTRKQAYESMAGQADRMTRLINDVLDLNRIEQGRPLEARFQNVDLTDVVSRLARAYQLSTKTHRIEISLSQSLVPIVGDEDRIEQIVANLLSNALKYSREGSVVKVAVTDEDETAVISVADQGVGIASEQMPRLFQPYTRLQSESTRTVRGSGLGLYLTKQLVEVHGGQIWVDSEVDKGSVFSVRLPKLSPQSGIYE